MMKAGDVPSADGEEIWCALEQAVAKYFPPAENIDAFLFAKVGNNEGEVSHSAFSLRTIIATAFSSAKRGWGLIY